MTRVPNSAQLCRLDTRSRRRGGGVETPIGGRTGCDVNCFSLRVIRGLPSAPMGQNQCRAGLIGGPWTCPPVPGGGAESGWCWTSLGSPGGFSSVAHSLGWEPSGALALGEDANISPCLSPGPDDHQKPHRGGSRAPRCPEDQLAPLTSSSPGRVGPRVTRSIPTSSAAVANDVYCILCNIPRHFIFRG